MTLREHELPPRPCDRLSPECGKCLAETMRMLREEADAYRLKLLSAVLVAFLAGMALGWFIMSYK